MTFLLDNNLVQTEGHKQNFEKIEWNLYETFGITNSFGVSVFRFKKSKWIFKAKNTIKSLRLCSMSNILTEK